MEKILKTIAGFAAQAGTIIRHPWTFPDELEIDISNAFGRGFKFLSLASGVTYILLLPVYVIHDKSVGEGVILLVNITALFAAGVFVHIGLKILGSRGVSFSETMGLYGFQLGMQMVVFTVLSYLNVLRYGPVVLFGGNDEEMNRVAEQVAISFSSYLAVWLVASGVGLVWVLTCWIPMYARYHGFQTLGKIRVTVALVLGALVGSQILIHSLEFLHDLGGLL